MLSGLLVEPGESGKSLGMGADRALRRFPVADRGGGDADRPGEFRIGHTELTAHLAIVGEAGRVRRAICWASAPSPARLLRFSSNRPRGIREASGIRGRASWLYSPNSHVLGPFRRIPLIFLGWRQIPVSIVAIHWKCIFLWFQCEMQYFEPSKHAPPSTSKSNATARTPSASCAPPFATPRTAKSNTSNTAASPDCRSTLCATSRPPCATTSSPKTTPRPSRSSPPKNTGPPPPCWISPRTSVSTAPSTPNPSCHGCATPSP